jgi:hypothetical protein
MKGCRTSGKKLFLFALLCCAIGSSCTKKDKSYYERRGEEVKHQLIVELEGASSLHDLFDRQDLLTLLFDELSKVAIEARVYQLKTKKIWEPSADSLESSHKMAAEMRRLLEIPGARAFLEKCQTKGFERIDAFEKTRERSISRDPLQG